MIVVYVLAGIAALFLARQLWRANKKVNAWLAGVKRPTTSRTANPGPKENHAA